MDSRRSPSIVSLTVISARPTSLSYRTFSMTPKPLGTLRVGEASVMVSTDSPIHKSVLRSKNAVAGDCRPVSRVIFCSDDASLVPLLADSEKPLLRPVVLAHQLPEVDKRPSGGLRTTVEVVIANRAFVSSRTSFRQPFFDSPSSVFADLDDGAACSRSLTTPEREGGASM